MFELPPMQNWDAMHPLIIHIPIGLLLFVPIIIMLGLVAKQNKDTYYLIGFIILVAGSIGLLLAIASGEAAANVADTSIGNSKAILEEHEELAETTRNVYLILTLLYAAFLFLPKVIGKVLSDKVKLLGNIAFAVIFCIGIIFVVNTAHYGGVLVHEFGIKSKIKSSNVSNPAQQSVPNPNNQTPQQPGNFEKKDKD